MKKGKTRFYLDPEFRKNLFDSASEKGTSKELGRKLGYIGKYTGKRFNELRNGVIKTLSRFQLEQLSVITGIPLENILKHTTIVE